MINCREDEVYNQKYLNEMNGEFIRGFDWAVKWGADNMFDNLEVVYDMFEIAGEDINLAKYLSNHPKVLQSLRDAIQFYSEMSRNDLIISMIDHMTDEEYQEIKSKIDGEK